MTDARIEAFVRESREGITEMNNGLLALEKDPDDDGAMEGIFRTAHTLKGNFGALGYDDAGDLAHALEDLLDAIRDGSTEPTPEVMDLLFAAVDRIEVLVDEIDETGAPQSGPGDLPERLRGTIDAGTDSTGSAPEESDESADAPGEHPEDPAASADADGSNQAGGAPSESDSDARAPTGEAGAAGAEVRLSVETDGPMPAVDGALVLDAFEESDAPALVSTTPDQEAIREGEFDGGFELAVADADSAAIAAFVTGLQPVESVDVVAAVPDPVTDTSEETDEAGAADESGEAGVPADTAEASGNADAAGGGTDGGADGADAAGGGTDGGADGADAAGGGTDDSDAGASDSTGGAGEGGEELSSIRIDVDQLDALHSLVEQLVTSRIKLRRAVEESEAETARDPLNELEKISSALQDTVMDLRLIPLEQVVGGFPRLVRDIARKEDKAVDFEMTGTGIELDRRILNQIGDPLIHILRNAVDHGIEPPEEREALGKDRRGQIELRASRDRDEVVIEVEDDGGGLDPERIEEKAVQQGLRSRAELAAMDRSDVYDLVYESGFSTAEEVDDVSGRGVGMDVVSATVDRLDGTVSVESDPGEGTLVRIRLPVTAAIAKVLFVEVGDEEYGIPIKHVDDVSHMEAPETVDGTDVIEHNEDIYPLVRLGKAFDVDGATTNGDGVLVRVPPKDRQIALHCDAVTQQEEVVIRPATGALGDVDGLSGTTVVGDGNVVPILDVTSI